MGRRPSGRLRAGTLDRVKDGGPCADGQDVRLSSAAIRKYLPAGTTHTQIAHQCRNAFFTSFKFIDRSFSSYHLPLFQNEVKCEVFDSVISCNLNLFTQERFHIWLHFESEFVWKLAKAYLH